MANCSRSRAGYARSRRSAKRIKRLLRLGRINGNISFKFQSYYKVSALTRRSSGKRQQRRPAWLDRYVSGMFIATITYSRAGKPPLPGTRRNTKDAVLVGLKYIPKALVFCRASTQARSVCVAQPACKVLATFFCSSVRNFFTLSSASYSSSLSRYCMSVSFAAGNPANISFKRGRSASAA